MSKSYIQGAKDWILAPINIESGQEIYYITQAEAENIAKQWRSFPNTELHDEEGRLIGLIPRKDYRLLKRTDVNTDSGRKFWVCDYGERHSMAQGCYVSPHTGNKEWRAGCECSEKYGISHHNFIDWCRKFYKNVKTSFDIEPYMQKEFLRVHSVKG